MWTSAYVLCLVMAFFFFIILEIWTLPPRLHQLHQPGVKKCGYRGKTTSLALPHVHCDPARISVSASHLLVTLLDDFSSFGEADISNLLLVLQLLRPAVIWVQLAHLHSGGQC